MTYENLIQLLFMLLKDNVKCEDNEIRIKNALKYDVFNLLERIEPIKMQILKDELEYEEEVE